MKSIYRSPEGDGGNGGAPTGGRRRKFAPGNRHTLRPFHGFLLKGGAYAMVATGAQAALSVRPEEIRDKISKCLDEICDTTCHQKKCALYEELGDLYRSLGEPKSAYDSYCEARDHARFLDSDDYERITRFKISVTAKEMMDSMPKNPFAAIPPTEHQIECPYHERPKTIDEKLAEAHALYEAGKKREAAGAYLGIYNYMGDRNKLDKALSRAAEILFELNAPTAQHYCQLAFGRTKEQKFLDMVNRLSLRNG